jgi:hypothetical protein
LVSNINSASADKKIILIIESSASYVPTSKFGNNETLAKARAEAMKKALMKEIKNKANVKLELKSGVNGPAYNNDYQDQSKYEKYQYVKAFIAEDK